MHETAVCVGAIRAAWRPKTLLIAFGSLNRTDKVRLLHIIRIYAYCLSFLFQFRDFHTTLLKNFLVTKVTNMQPQAPFGYKVIVRSVFRQFLTRYQDLYQA